MHGGLSLSRFLPLHGSWPVILSFDSCVGITLGTPMPLVSLSSCMGCSFSQSRSSFLFEGCDTTGQTFFYSRGEAVTSCTFSSGRFWQYVPLLSAASACSSTASKGDTIGLQRSFCCTATVFSFFVLPSLPMLHRVPTSDSPPARNRIPATLSLSQIRTGMEANGKPPPPLLLCLFAAKTSVPDLHEFRGMTLLTPRLPAAHRRRLGGVVRRRRW